MATKEQMNPTSRVSITASQARENSRTDGSKHMIVYSVLTHLIFKEVTEEGQYCRTAIEPAKAAEFEQRVSKFLLDTNIIINSNTNLDLGFLQIKDKKNVSNPLNPLIKKILVEQSMN